MIDGRRLPNGLDVRKVRVPLGVVAVVYEARPNVTIDAAALCLKSGNAIVLRGSSSAEHSNARCSPRSRPTPRRRPGCPTAASASWPAEGARSWPSWRPREDSVDLIIPRGGEGLKAALQAVATVPVIYAASGNCHVYVDASAELDQAEAIVINAKTPAPRRVQRRRDAAGPQRDRAGVRPAHPALARRRGRARARGRAHAGARAARGEPRRAARRAVLEPAGEEDWASEYLALTLAVGVVDSVEEAIEHIGRYGSGHSEAIVTRDTAAARAFQLGVDAACVYVNASTRFTDGGEFGMGAEIGNSTQKLHARGPIGLRELCTFKYLVEGDGHVRA